MSDYIGWIIAALSMGMVAWPILQMVPSAAQKRQMAFRTHAKGLGIHIQMRRPELPPQLTGQYQQLIGCVAYHLPDFDSQLNGTYTALRSQNEKGQWFWVHARPHVSWLEKMLPAYQAIADNVLAIEQSRAGTTIFWRETGEVEAVDAIFQQLESLNQLITHHLHKE